MTGVPTDERMPRLGAQALRRPRQFPLQLRVRGRDRHLGRAHLQAECHQPLLQPVVQVALDPPPGVVDGRHGAGPGGALLDDPGQLHPGPDGQLAEHPPQMRADRRLGQPHPIRHHPAAEALRGQVSHRPFGISQAQLATGGQTAPVRAIPEAVADLPCRSLGEREQQRPLQTANSATG
jgi:hypothetical protein